MSPKEIHDIRAALRTLRMAHELIESGYKFDDDKAPEMIAHLGKMIEVVTKTVQEKVLNEVICKDVKKLRSLRI